MYPKRKAIKFNKTESEILQKYMIYDKKEQPMYRKDQCMNFPSLSFPLTELF